MAFLSPDKSSNSSRKVDWSSMKPVYGDKSGVPGTAVQEVPVDQEVTVKSQIDWASMKPEAPKAGMPPPTEIDPVEGYYSTNRLGKAWELTKDVMRGSIGALPAVEDVPSIVPGKATGIPDIARAGGRAITKAAMPVIPAAGFEDLFETTMDVIFVRPMAAMTALAKDTPFDGSGRTGVLETVYNGLSNPEKYPPTEMVTALTDSGMEPTSAAALATLGQFGFYLGAGKAVANVVTTGKVSVLQGAIKNVGDAIQKANGRTGATLSFKPEIARVIAENTDVATVVDIYAKSRGMRLCRNNGTVQLLRNVEVPKDVKTYGIKAGKAAAPDKPTVDPYQRVIDIRQADARSRTPVKDAVARTGARAINEANRAFVPISTRLAKISENLKHALRKFEFRSRRSAFANIVRIKPFLEKYSKLPMEDVAVLDFALKNRNVARVNEVIARNDMQKEFAEVKTLLDELHTQAATVDIGIGYLEDYFPRRIGNAEGFLQYLRGSENWSAIDEAIRIQEQSQGYEMLDTEKADFIGKLLRGTGGTGIWLEIPANVKARLIDEITPEMDRYYKDSSQALLDYVEGMNMAIEIRRFFGKGEGSVDKSIGMYVQNLIKDGMLDTAQAQEIRSILKARFNEHGTRGLWTTWKNLAYMATMNSPLNAITQIGDLAFAIYKSGYLRTGAAIFSKGITKEDIGIHNIAMEFSGDAGTSGKAVNVLFKAIGLEKIDRIGKEALINSSLARLQAEARRRGDKLLPQLTTVFGEEAGQVLADLKNGVVSEDVKYLLFSELSDFQPITHAEMPEYYLSGGNSRILYMLKSYTLKVIDAYHNEVFRNMKKDPIKSMQNLIALTSALAVMGVTSDWLKDLLLGKVGTLSDYVMNNIVKQAGFNKYAMADAKRDGIVSAFIQSILPPVPFVDTVVTDLMRKKEIPDWRTWGAIPMVGKFYYWWFGGGAKRKLPPASY